MKGECLSNVGCCSSYGGNKLPKALEKGIGVTTRLFLWMSLFLAPSSSLLWPVCSQVGCWEPSPQEEYQFLPSFPSIPDLNAGGSALTQQGSHRWAERAGWATCPIKQGLPG